MMVLSKFGKLDSERFTMEEQMIAANALLEFAIKVKPLVDKYSKPQRQYSASEIRDILSRMPKEVKCSESDLLGEEKSGVTS